MRHDMTRQRQAIKLYLYLPLPLFQIEDDVDNVMELLLKVRGTGRNKNQKGASHYSSNYSPAENRIESFTSRESNQTPVGEG
jgi:hypothetical protein